MLTTLLLLRSRALHITGLDHESTAAVYPGHNRKENPNAWRNRNVLSALREASGISWPKKAILPRKMAIRGLRSYIATNAVMFMGSFQSTCLRAMFHPSRRFSKFFDTEREH